MHKHIINGYSAAGLLAQYLRKSPDTFSVFEDSLITGPLFLFKNEETFLSKRAYFWKKNSHSKTGFIPRSLRKFCNEIKEASHFTLWLSGGMHDQFMWTWLVYLLDLYGKDWTNVKVKYLAKEENGEFIYVHMHEQNLEEFNLCSDFKLTDERLILFKKAYEALSSNTPALLEVLCNKKEFSLLQLQISLRDYLKIYPDPNSGLGLLDKVLLMQFMGKKYKSARIIGFGLGNLLYDHKMCVGDRYLFYRLVRLSQLHAKKPLVHLHGTVKGSHSMRYTEVEITELGQAVLSGKENQIELNGIDETIGGVHLSSEKETDIWFYDDGHIVSK